MRKKFRFTFHKKKNQSTFGSASPSEKKYDELMKKYGDEPDFITALGIKIFPSGDQFVIDAKSGRVIKRDKLTRYLGRDAETGLHLYLSDDTELNAADPAYPSFAKEKKRV